MFHILTLICPSNLRCMLFFTHSIEMDDFYGDPNNLNLEDGDSSDDDFFPSLHLRYFTCCKFFVEIKLPHSFLKTPYI